MIDWRTDEDAWIESHRNTLTELQKVVIEHLIVPACESFDACSGKAKSHPPTFESDTWYIATNLLMESQYDLDSKAHRLGMGAVEELRKNNSKVIASLDALDNDARRWIEWNPRSVATKEAPLSVGKLQEQLRVLERNIESALQRLPRRIPKSNYPPIFLLRECERLWENMGLRHHHENDPPQKIFESKNWEKELAEYRSEQKPFTFNPGIDDLMTKNEPSASTKFGKFVLPIFLAVGFKPSAAQTAHDHLWRKSEN